jgi:hypothetical protein
LMAHIVCGAPKPIVLLILLSTMKLFRNNHVFLYLVVPSRIFSYATCTACCTQSKYEYYLVHVFSVQ